MTGISVGDYRDPERGLELGELMVAVAQVPGVRARAAVERRGDPRQGLAARGARRPSRRSARTCTSRCSRATTRCCATWAATTPPPSTWSTSRALRAAAPGRQPHHRRDRRLPDRGRGRLRAHAGRGRRRRHHAASTRSRTRRGRAPSRRRSATASRPQEKKRRSRELRGRSEVRSRHHRAAKLGGTGARADRQGRRHAVLGLHRRLHPLLPAGRAPAHAGELSTSSARSCTPTGSRCRAPGCPAGLS